MTYEAEDHGKCSGVPMDGSLECSNHKGHQRELLSNSMSCGLIAGSVSCMSPGTIP